MLEVLDLKIFIICLLKNNFFSYLFLSINLSFDHNQSLAATATMNNNFKVFYIFTNYKI